MRSRHIGAVVVGAATLGIALLSAPGGATAHDVAAEIEKVRLATQKYEDVNVALAEGYIPAPPGDCVTAAKEGLPRRTGRHGNPLYPSRHAQDYRHGAAR